MCGITGFLYHDRARRAADADLTPMLRAIVHRGPDDEGRWLDGPLAMGMRRLSIIDLADGTQPIHDCSGRYTIVFNGEIYNYRELRRELIETGHCLRTQSDTEVIVHLYEHYGRRCVEHLRGMFAFAIWDRVERRLFLARDRMGIKPLYFAQRDGVFVFGSEMKAILQHPAIDARLDHAALSAYLSLKYVPAPRTMFAGIRSLPPGHAVTIRGEQVEIDRYWDMHHQAPERAWTEHEAVDRLETLLKESVSLRLRSDVPFGAFLSGGIDSSLIVALMAKQLGEPVKTFSVGFDDGDEADELPYAQRVAEQFGCSHHTLKITADDFLKHAQAVMWHLDQPIADQATVATYMVAKLARQHVKMVLTGEGGDELFAGYARYGADHWHRLCPPVSDIMCRNLRRLVGRFVKGRRLRIAAGALLNRDESQRLANWFPLFQDDARETLIADSRLAGNEARQAFAAALDRCGSSDRLDRMLYADCQLWLPDYLLLRGDKLTMANSLEARVPLLDHALVDFTTTLPSSWKLRGRTRKYLLKKVAARHLPGAIIHRRKQGFPIPIDQWLRGPARELVEDHLFSATAKQRGLFNPSEVRRLVQAHQQGRGDFATEIWGLVSLEMWMRRFLDAPAASLQSSSPSVPSGGAVIG